MRLALLTEKSECVEELAGSGELPDITIESELLSITPFKTAAPKAAAQVENEARGVLPHVKVTELLLEVDRWCDFTRHFTHLRIDQPTNDRPVLLTVVLADATNLGLSKMVESCPGSSFRKLDTLRAWHVRDESYAKALAEQVNYQHQLPFAAHWGGGTTSSSDGQRYPVGGRGRHAGAFNLRYGTEPGLTFYTRISDRDATHVLDGLLYHESDICIESRSTQPTRSDLRIMSSSCVTASGSALHPTSATLLSVAPTCPAGKPSTRRSRRLSIATSPYVRPIFAHTGMKFAAWSPPSATVR